MPVSGEISCIAIIPARGGSKGLPRKNVLAVGGIPLVARTIMASLKSGSVQKTYVSTDDAEIARVAEQYGAEIIWRPQEIAGDTASSEAALLHGLEILAKDGVKPEKLVFLQCTSPFTTAGAIDKVVSALDNSEVAQSNCPAICMAFSAVEDHGFLWGMGDDGAGYGINHDHTKQRERRQDRALQLRETGAIYVMRVEPFLKSGNRFCGPVRPVELDLPALEIDTMSDLEAVNALLETKSSERKNTPPPPGIKALVTDFDGVHTDDRVYVNERGEEMVACSRSDGMGIEMLKKAGIQVLILSKETNPVVTARAAKLKIPVIQSCNDKKTALQNWMRENNLKPEEVAYMGNDVNDIECMQMVGWSCCPADANTETIAASDYVSQKVGGYGAIRLISQLFTYDL